MTAEFFSSSILIVPINDWGQTSQTDIQVNSTISFHVRNDNNIQTLSTSGISAGDTVRGLLYVPSLKSSDPCLNFSSSYVPQNVTGSENVLGEEYPLVAIAPWISVNCTQSYLAAARDEVALQAFVFYLPNNDTDRPPPVSDPAWSLNDGGKWKATNHFPIYAIPGLTGGLMMHALSAYTGNLSDLKNTSSFASQFNPDDYYASLLMAIVTASGGPELPSLWVFLIIVLAILFFVIITTSVSMHLILRRQRRSLQRRVATGEVDLEALGIKRLNVPQENLDKMPTYVYTSNDSRKDETSRGSPKDLSPDITLPKKDASLPNPGNSVLSSAQSSTEAPHQGVGNLLDQPTCPICLDDFEPGNTTVRELPCRHIFHPDCVDGFLLNNSSLCPMCKKSVLPPGYVPKQVTNAMVRRERIMRRSRGRAIENTNNSGSLQGHSVTPGGRMDRFSRQFSRATLAGRRISSAPMRGIMEMRQVSRSSPPESVPRPPRDLDISSRREWARRRAISLLGQQPTLEDEDAERQARLPKWRRAVIKVFPGFR